MQITEGIANATAVQLDIMDHGSLCKYISQVESFPHNISDRKIYQQLLSLMPCTNSRKGLGQSLEEDADTGEASTMISETQHSACVY